MKNYYEETIESIKNLIKEGNYKKANELLTEELKAPYIPKKEEETFLKLEREIFEYYKNMRSTKIDSKETVLEKLESKDINIVSAAIFSLKNFNLNKDDLPSINRFFSTSNQQLKTIFFSLLNEQKFDHNIKFKKDNKVYELNPSKINIDSYYKIEEIVNILSNNLLQEPSLLNIASGLMDQFFLNVFPDKSDLTIDELSFCFHQKAKELLHGRTSPLLLEKYKVTDLKKTGDFLIELDKILAL